MIDPWNRVMTNLLTALTGQISSIQSNTTDTPPKFPALAVESIGDSDAATDLENGENAVNSMIRIRSYSVNGLTEARTVIGSACDAMRTMGYIRSFGPEPIPNYADFNIRCMEARFRRIVTDVDLDIPKFATE